jgi:acetyl esterase
MLLDPVLKAFLDQLDAQPGPKAWELNAPEARGLLRTLMQFVGPNNIRVGAICDLAAPGPGGAIRLRSYSPLGADADVLPALIFYHGGGFVIGDLETHDGLCRLLANDSGARVISVDYRLAPEHRFPAAVDDAYAAFNWIAANGARLGVDTRRIAVGGDSAGGALATVVSRMAISDTGSKPVFQLLLFPVTDYAAKTQSRRNYADGYFLDKRTIAWFFENYVPQGTDLHDPRLSPLYAASVKGMPPAWLLTAGCDPLHDEGIEYAEKLRAAGVPVVIEDYSGLVHDFIYLYAVLPQAGKALRAAAHAVRTALTTG